MLQEGRIMYQETEKFEKYGKYFAICVGGSLLVPFLISLGMQVVYGSFEIVSFLSIAIVFMIPVIIVLILVIGNGIVLKNLVRGTAKKIGELPYHFYDSIEGEANGSTLFIDTGCGMIAYISAYNPFKIQVFKASRVDRVKKVASAMTGIRLVFYLDGKKVIAYAVMKLAGHALAFVFKSFNVLLCELSANVSPDFGKLHLTLQAKSFLTGGVDHEDDSSY